jgi:hypothetical protein
MNNFGSAEELKLAATMFQNLFPSINVSKVKLKTCQVLVSPPSHHALVLPYLS